MDKELDNYKSQINKLKIININLTNSLEQYKNAYNVLLINNIKYKQIIQSKL